MTSTLALSKAILGQEAVNSLRGKALLEKLKEIPYIFNVSPTWKSLNDKTIVGATVSAPSLIRTRITIQRLKDEGWKVEDKWPASTRIYISFEL